ncbi:MAG: vitamin K epoxide reductase family protein [Pirellulaceae bacterium]
MQLRLLCLTLIGFGLLASGYLLSRHEASLRSEPLGFDVCSALFGAGCDDALNSPIAEQFGLPLAAWGVVYYGTLASLLLLGWWIGDPFRVESSLAALLLSLAAAVISIVLAGAMLSGASPVCPFCLAVHVINLLLVFALKRFTGQSIGQLRHALAGGCRFVLGRTSDPTSVIKWKSVGILAAGLVALSIYQWACIQVGIRPVATEAVFFDPDKTLAEFQSSPRHEIPVREDDPHLGRLDAAVQIVVFTDFQCPGCRGFFHILSGLTARFDGQLHVVFKHFPLATACNHAIGWNMHPRSCEWAYAAEAARRQGKFWAYHDLLFATDLNDHSSPTEPIAIMLGLDIDRWRADCGSEDVRFAITEDVTLATRLEVVTTPAVFLNQRRVRDLRSVTLQYLIAHELAAAK